MLNKKRSAKLGGTGCLVAVLSLFLLAGCGQSALPKSEQPANQGASQSNTAKAPANKIKIVAAENFYGEIAQAVGGDQVEVTSILTNPTVDPHDYEPTVEDSKLVSDSQLVVYNGIGYDGWMDNLLKSETSSGDKKKISVGSGLMGKKQGDNPHIWYNPTTMPMVANAIADSLSKLDPAQADTFKKNAKTYITSLNPLQKQVAKLKVTAQTPIDVSEPVFDYMAQALNLTISNTKFSKAVEEGTDPSPKDVGQIQSDIKGKKIKMFIDNTQADSPNVKNFAKLAESSGVPVIKVTETEPTGRNYLQWMTDQLNEVEKALKTK